MVETFRIVNLVENQNRQTNWLEPYLRDIVLLSKSANRASLR